MSETLNDVSIDRNQLADHRIYVHMGDSYGGGDSGITAIVLTLSANDKP
jgi:hypothetical protein